MVHAVDVKDRLRRFHHDLGVRLEDDLDMSDRELLVWICKVLKRLTQEYNLHMRYNRGQEGVDLHALL